LLRDRKEAGAVALPTKNLPQTVPLRGSSSVHLLKSFGSPFKRIGLEAGSSSSWLCTAIYGATGTGKRRLRFGRGLSREFDQCCEVGLNLTLNRVVRPLLSDTWGYADPGVDDLE
jgi:hypothetical protein